jgi:hypothetical protein
MYIDTKLIANLFINCIVPQYKKSFEDHWIDALELSCPPTTYDVQFGGLGLTKDQADQITRMGARVSNCFESLLKNVLVLKTIKV